MVTFENQFKPDYVPHPGLMLEERLEELGMSIKEFAIRTGKPEQTIIKIIGTKSAITSDMAVQFEDVLKIPASLWLKMQYSYDEYLARLKRQEVIESSYEWARAFPYADMARKGWVKTTSKVEEKVSALFNFFGMSNVQAWEDYYYSQKLRVNFRISLKHMQESYAVSAWLRQGEIQVNEINAPEYNESKLKEALPKFKLLMANHPDDFFLQLQSICLDCGVKVVYTPNLPKAPIHGSTRWIKGNPVIQLSARRKQNDGFWFTFFHEVGHILLHGKKYISIENVGYTDMDKQKEDEADAFAVENVFTEKEEHEVVRFAMNKESISDSDIIRFAKQFGTHPAVIVGRLQFKNYISYSQGRHFIQSINLEQIS